MHNLLLLSSDFLVFADAFKDYFTQFTLVPSKLWENIGLF